MESSDQSQRPSEDNAAPYPTPPDDDQTVAMTSGVYPPPYAPPPSFPPTVEMAQPAMPALPAPGRLGRAQALDLLSRLKATLIAGSVLAFGVFAALAATHVTGVTSRSGDAQNSQATPTATAAPSRRDDDGGFFNTTGPSSGFGVGAPSPQGPASGTSVS